MNETVSPGAESACASCPWRKSNRGKESPKVEGFSYRWYSKQNCNRLWRGLRDGERMTCHPTDSRHPQISGKSTPSRVQTRECAGALILVQREVMTAQSIADNGFRRYRRERPRGLTVRGIASVVERVVFAFTPMARPDLNDADVQHEPLGEWKGRP
jgi:hypothetical protein